MARVVSVNTGVIAPLETGQGVVPSAIRKRPVHGRLLASGTSLAGDEIADCDNHGGYHQAVYFYASEDHAWWESELGRPLGPGFFGENLTTEGIDVDGLPVGTRVRAGEALLEISQPRIPCFKQAAVASDNAFVKRFAQARRPGSYARIIEPGTIGAGDALTVVFTPAHTLSTRDIANIYFFDRKAAGRMREAGDYLSEGWRDWMLSNEAAQPQHAD